MPRICLVTGSNKGIGLEAVRQISKEYTDNDFVYITSRNEQRGREAIKNLAGEGLRNIRYLQLDIENVESIKIAAEQISKAHGKLDVLVNNAGIYCDPNSAMPFGQQAEVSNRINYFGTLSVTNGFFELLKNGGLIVNVGSALGELAQVSKNHQKRLTSSKLTIEDLTEFVDDFTEKAKANSHDEAGYSSNSYGMSKLAMIAMTKVQAREFAKDNITVVVMCPGYCQTDMTGGLGWHSASKGAESITYLVKKANIHDFSGNFFSSSATEW